MRLTIPARRSSAGVSPALVIMLIVVAVAPLLLVGFGCASQAMRRDGSADAIVPTGSNVTCIHGVVVSVSAAASEVGRDVLRGGGNAVDAAVATAFALAVTYPEAGNIGGGGFMLVYPGPGAHTAPAFIDYRETAPAASSRDMFAAGKPSSAMLVGVPGTVRGLALAHRRFGRLAWKELVTPAVKLATDGFAIDEYLAGALNDVVRSSSDFPELRRVFAKDAKDLGARWHAGDRLVQTDLARTLQQIADGGPDAFYEGPIAERLAEEVHSAGGIVTKEDLASYRAKEREPIHGTFRGYDVYSSPPPSSGGIVLLEMLNILENFDLRAQGRWEPATLHLVIEVSRRAYCDRAKFLGDADFVRVPSELITKAYAKKLASSINLHKATASEELAKQNAIPLGGDEPDTTHFSVIDAEGMAVANTYTLEQAWGGRIMVKGAGFLLNNEMGDFNPKPGISNRRGQIGTAANQVAPGKRMLSSMTPTIVAKNGKVVLVTGSPGGRTIINTVLCVTLNALEFGMSPREAVDAPRLHEAWFPDEVRAEAGLLRGQADAIAALRRMGHVVNAVAMPQGDAHSIFVDPETGRYTGVADTRKSGAAAGY